jgi:ribosomal protein S18 acetylase RimI-like enzyme
MAVEISQAGPERVQRLVEVLARSFADDPIIRWPFPTDGSHEEQCRELFRILDEPFAETGWLWEAGDAAGVALWVPPDGEARFLEIELESRDAIDAMTEDDGVRYRAFWDWIEDHLPTEPHWFLDHLAVAPEQRGEGLGTALVELGVGFARRDEAPAFLETARPGNVGYYERLGFRVVADEHAPGGGPRLWFMRFDP